MVFAADPPETSMPPSEIRPARRLARSASISGRRALPSIPSSAIVASSVWTTTSTIALPRPTASNGAGSGGHGDSLRMQAVAAVGAAASILAAQGRAKPAQEPQTPSECRTDAREPAPRSPTGLRSDLPRGRSQDRRDLGGAVRPAYRMALGWALDSPRADRDRAGSTGRSRPSPGPARSSSRMMLVPARSHHGGRAVSRGHRRFGRSQALPGQAARARTIRSFRRRSLGRRRQARSSSP